MASYTIHFMLCPHCGNRINKGIRYFGPVEVKCKHCQEVVPTRLLSWHDLSLGRKIWFSVLEILTPTWYGVRGFDTIMIFLFHLAVEAFCMLPFGLIGSIFEKTPGLFGFFMMLGVLTYPGILVVRLVRMILESESYTNKQQIPVWKS